MHTLHAKYINDCNCNCNCHTEYLCVCLCAYRGTSSDIICRENLHEDFFQVLRIVSSSVYLFLTGYKTGSMSQTFLISFHLITTYLPAKCCPILAE